MTKHVSLDITRTLAERPKMRVRTAKLSAISTPKETTNLAWQSENVRSPIVSLTFRIVRLSS